jgi:hypothetical protein
MTAFDWKSSAAAEQSASKHFAITASDSTDFTYLTRAIYVGTSGHVAVVTDDGTVVTYKNVPSGGRIDVVAKRVNSTNTTATDLVGMY